LQFSNTNGAKVFVLIDGFIVAVAAIHQTAMEDAVFHGEGMAKLMIDHFDEKLYVIF
jgi:hypothetical protein